MRWNKRWHCAQREVDAMLRVGHCHDGPSGDAHWSRESGLKQAADTRISVPKTESVRLRSPAAARNIVSASRRALWRDLSRAVRRHSASQESHAQGFAHRR